MHIALRMFVMAASIMIFSTEKITPQTSSFAFSAVIPNEAVALAERGLFRKTLVLIEPIAERYPGNSDLLCFHGYALVQTGEIDKGISMIKQAISMNDRHGIYHRLLGEAYGIQAKKSVSLSGMFTIYSAMTSAHAEFLAAVQYSPEDVKSRILLATFYIIAPGILGGSFDKAEKEIEVIKRYDMVQAILLQSTIAKMKNDYQSCESLLLAAATKDTTEKSFVELGIYYTEMKRYDEAFNVLRTAKNKFPHAVRAWYQIGRLAGMTKTNEEEGIRCLLQYINFEDLPDNIYSRSWAHFRLGNIYENKGWKNKAFSEYQTAQGLNSVDDELSSKITKAMAGL